MLPCFTFLNFDTCLIFLFLFCNWVFTETTCLPPRPYFYVGYVGVVRFGLSSYALIPIIKRTRFFTEPSNEDGYRLFVSCNYFCVFMNQEHRVFLGQKD